MLRLISIFLLFLSVASSEESMCQQMVVSDLVREKLKSIDAKDLLALNDFFRCLFRDNAFSYTLFSSKPMGFGGYGWHFVDASSRKSRHMRLIIDFEGWQAWQKYASLFPSRNFCLTGSGPTSFGFTIMNKERCQEVITQHLPIFQECFGKHAGDKEIFDIICSEDVSLYRNKKGFTTCFGILLGYGKTNSLACEKREHLFIQALYQAPYHLDGLTEKMKNRQGYFLVGLQPKSLVEGLEQPLSIQSVIEELNASNKTYRPIALVEKDSLCPIEDFRCAGSLDNPETRSLQLQYESDYQKLVDIYNAENFLELVLTQLTS